MLEENERDAIDVANDCSSSTRYTVCLRVTVGIYASAMEVNI